MIALYNLPTEFPAGTTVSYRRQTSEYPANDGWVITLYLAGPEEANAVGVADGADHIITLSALATAALTPGVYEWIEEATKGSTTYRVASGVVTVLTDLSVASSGSNQQWTERAIAALKAHIEGRLPAGLQSYQIANRVVSKMSYEEAMDLLGKLEARLARKAHPNRVTRSVLVSFPPTGFSS